MGDDTTTVDALRQLMREFVAERDWQKYHLPKNLAMAAAVEAGELMELYQWLTPGEAADRSTNDPAFRRAAADELADTVMYLLSFANALQLDVATAVREKMERNKRKYPAAEHKGFYQRPLPEG